MLAGVQRAVLIVNPYSTKVTGDGIAQVEATLREQVELRTEFTRGPGHATELAAEAEGQADAIVVFAGDGTYNEAMNGADGALPFGFLPGGGTSVFPRALGLPRDPGAAARVVATAIAKRRTRRISLGSVNGRRFCFSAGIGFDGEAVRRLDKLGRDVIHFFQGFHNPLGLHRRFTAFANGSYNYRYFHVFLPLCYTFYS